MKCYYDAYFRDKFNGINNFGYGTVNKAYSKEIVNVNFGAKIHKPINKPYPKNNDKKNKENGSYDSKWLLAVIKGCAWVCKLNTKLECNCSGIAVIWTNIIENIVNIFCDRCPMKRYFCFIRFDNCLII